jgi:hypothetical protein
LPGLVGSGVENRFDHPLGWNPWELVLYLEVRLFEVESVVFGEHLVGFDPLYFGAVLDCGRGNKVIPYRIRIQQICVTGEDSEDSPVVFEGLLGARTILLGRKATGSFQNEVCDFPRDFRGYSLGFFLDLRSRMWHILIR